MLRAGLPTAVASVALLCLLLSASTIDAGSLKASCTTLWTFPHLSCSQVSSKLVDQITAWSGATCPSNCLTCCYYTLVDSSSSSITASHKTLGFVQDLSFTLTASGEGCTVNALSVQESIFIVQDGGQDYCNLEDLVIGSKLYASSGYTEAVAGSTCTDLTKANCLKP